MESSSHRLDSIDVLRGVAALGVVVFHAGGGKNTSTPVRWLLSQGWAGVCLFFVISGFCIHLRVARRCCRGSDARLDFVAFWKRRFRRLYPPYLVSLLACSALALLSHEVHLGRAFFRDLALHLAMLHNIDAKTVYTLNGVFWTLAIEEQLYLLYFVLLVLRRHLGWGATLAICFAARIAWYQLMSSVNPIAGVWIPSTESAASQWFLWALGAVSVEGAVGLIRLPRWSRSPWLALTVLLAQAALDGLDRSALSPSAQWLLSMTGYPVWGFGFFVAVNWLVDAENEWRRSSKLPWAVRPLAWVGLLSYSLYLIHEPLNSRVVAPALRAFPLSTALGLLLGVLALIAAALVVARAFFALFERPFLSTRPFAA
jgi:peptidoglycan/LPS O-acetylase OafA/YrhL